MKDYKSPSKMTNKTNAQKMEYIHMLLVNGQKKEMAKEIEEWGNTFWEDYRYYLDPLYWAPSSAYNYFAQAVILYHRLKK